MDKRSQLSKFKLTMPYPCYKQDSVFIAIINNRFILSFNSTIRTEYINSVQYKALFELREKYKIFNNRVSVHSSLSTLISTNFTRLEPIHVIELSKDLLEIRSEYTIEDMSSFIVYFKLNDLKK